MKQEEIKAMFNKIDSNGDGYISQEEFVQAAQENGLVADPTEIDTFMRQIDTDKDGKVSFEEFSHFVQFNKSQLSDLKFLLNLTSQSIGYSKKIEKVMDVKDINKEHPSMVKILLRDQEAKGISELMSSLQIHIGNYDSNEHISTILKKQIDSNGALGFKFHVENKALVKKNFEEYIEALKDFLGELGPDASKIINELNIQLIEVEDGVMLIIDPATHPFIANYMDILKTNFEQLQNLKSAFSLMIGSGENLADRQVTYEQLLDSNFYFELSGRSIRLSNLAHTPSIKNTLQKLNANKESKSALLAALCALSFKSANVELLLNSSDRKEFVKQAEIKNLDGPVWESHVNMAKEQLSESGIGDFLDSLDFIKQAMQDLKKANCSSITVFAKVHNVHALVNVKAGVYSILNELFGLQG